MIDPISRLRCVECGSELDPREIHYRCTCGGLLEVHHDLERLRALVPGLRERFEQRLGARRGVHASGVWRYHELILPDLPAEQIITCGEGNTPLYASPRISRLFDTDRLFLKHEGENPTLSFKDRGMTAGVSWAHHLG
ncbi:MAG: pyridoxal-phosphate dependent enzyme, partial [Planctomycetota bacterium]